MVSRSAPYSFSAAAWTAVELALLLTVAPPIAALATKERVGVGFCDGSGTPDAGPCVLSSKEGLGR